MPEYCMVGILQYCKDAKSCVSKKAKLRIRIVPGGYFGFSFEQVKKLFISDKIGNVMRRDTKVKN